MEKDSSELFKTWKPEPDSELNAAIYEMLMKAWLLGMMHASRKKGFDFSDISLDFGLTYDEAINFAEGRVALTPDDFEKLSDHMKMHAFTVGRLSQLDQIEKAKQLYLDQLKSPEMSMDEFIKQAYEQLGEQTGFPGYYEMVFRTNLQKDYNAGKSMEMEEDPPAFLEFIGIEDERQSDICKAYSGRILPYTDPWWDTHWPPLHYNCRSTVREIFEDEATELINAGYSKNKQLDNNIETTASKKRQERMKTIQPQGSFGTRPSMDNAFWAAEPSQQKRIIENLIQEELNGVAGETICKDFNDPKPGFTYSEVKKGGVRYPNALVNDKEFKDNLDTAKVLAEQEGYFVELRKAAAVDSNSQFDSWLNGIQKAEFKNLTSQSKGSLEKTIYNAFAQSSTLVLRISSNEQIEPLSRAIKSAVDLVKRKRQVTEVKVILDNKVVSIPGSGDTITKLESILELLNQLSA